MNSPGVRRPRSRSLNHANDAIENKRISVGADFQHVFARVGMWCSKENGDDFVDDFAV